MPTPLAMLKCECGYGCPPTPPIEQLAFESEESELLTCCSPPAAATPAAPAASLDEDRGVLQVLVLNPDGGHSVNLSKSRSSSIIIIASSVPCGDLGLRANTPELLRF
jgi:hypothetical protein